MKKRNKFLKNCEICGNIFYGKRKTCSEECCCILKSKSLKEKYSSGELNWLKEKQKEIGTLNLINYNKSEIGKEKSSEITTKRNLENNPMNSEESRNKSSKTRKEGLISGRIKNPMLNPEIAKKAGQKRKESYDSGEKIHHMKDKKLAKQVSVSLKKAYEEGRLHPPNILNGNRYKRGYFIDKNNKKHHYASGWELSRMKFLDSCPEIKWKKLNSEYRIPYIDLNGNKRTYFPDFEIIFNNKIIVEEVGDFTKEKENKIKFAMDYFKNRNEIYVAIGKRGLNGKSWS